MIDLTLEELYIDLIDHRQDVGKINLKTTTKCKAGIYSIIAFNNLLLFFIFRYTSVLNISE